MRTAAAILLLTTLVSPASSAPAPDPGRWITVEGEGEAKARPDIMVFTAGVSRDAKDAAGARAQAAAVTARMVTVLSRAGVAEADIQTSQASVEPQYSYEQGRQPVQTGFRGTMAMTVRLRKLDQYDQLAASLTDAGATEIRGSGFESSKDKELAAEARRLAVADARLRAETLAKAAGAKLGRIRFIEERGGARPVAPLNMPRMPGGAPAPSAVAPGEITVRVSIQASWEIE